MKRKIMKTLAIGVAIVMMVSSLAGCGKSADSNASLTGKISIAGSTSMEKLCEAMSESFMEAYPDITVTVEYTGSGAGIESLTQGSIDIGNASRGLKDGEKEQGAVENIVAIDGIAVITDKANTVADLTSEQLASIYTGDVTNWSEFGGSDEAIVVIGREAGSGTRSAFEELLKVEDTCKYAQELDSTGAVLAKVASTPGAIGYVSLDVVDDTVTAVSLNGAPATEESILAGEYLLSRPFVMATMGEIAEQNELVQTWFAYIASEEGKAVITDLGLILPVAKGTPAFANVGVSELLFGTLWKPTASNASYGILYIILSSIVGTGASVLIGVPVGLFTAVFLTEISNKKLAAVVQPAVELLAAIPSVIYGLLGLMLLNPVMFKLEKLIFAGSKTHQFTGGSNMLSAVVVLAIMILPTVVNVSASSIRSVSKDLRAASLALGASKIQTIFKVTIPAAKSGIMTGSVLGIGRALGEAMAINMVAGGSVNLPLPFNSVRFLTTQLVSEMGYAEGTHRQVLFSVGLVLYLFIMIINLLLQKLRKGATENE